MPFTPSHAIVALPFVRTPLVPAAIAIGAMAPDFPLFFHLGIAYDDTHGIPGMFLVSIPLALILVLIWRMLLAPASVDLTPRPLAERAPLVWRDGVAAGWWSLCGGRDASPLGRMIAVAVLVASSGVGVVSHVLWDEFTHDGRWGSALIPALSDGWGPLPGYQWLQYASSVVGLVILAIWFGRSLAQRPRRSFERTVPGWIRLGYWASLPVVTLASALRTFLRFGDPAVDGFAAFAFRAGTTAGAFILVVSLIAAVTVLFARRRSLPEQAADGAVPVDG